jgi:hypothetical protein
MRLVTERIDSEQSSVHYHHAVNFHQKCVYISHDPFRLVALFLMYSMLRRHFTEIGSAMTGQH